MARACRGKICDVCFGSEVKRDVLGRTPVGSPVRDVGGAITRGIMMSNCNGSKASTKIASRRIFQASAISSWSLLRLEEPRTFVRRVQLRDTPPASKTTTSGQKKRRDFATTLEHMRITSAPLLNSQDDTEITT